MVKTTKRQILCMLLALCMMLTLMPEMAFASPDEEVTPSPCCYDCVRDGYTIDDIRQMFDGDEQDYQEIRIYHENGEITTYRVPVEDDESERVMDIEQSDGSPPIEFRYYRIRDSGKSHEDSIVVMLFGDGFASRQFGYWDEHNPDPAPGTALWHADAVIDRMLIDTHPFNLFADYFTVYMVHAAPYDQQPGVNGYFGSVTAAGRFFLHYEPSSVLRRDRVSYYASRIVPNLLHRNMTHVISNAPGLQGIAGGTIGDGAAYNRHHAFAFSATQRPDATDGVNATHTSWHGTFLHEFGHSFGGLADEHVLQGAQQETRANSTRAPDEEVKWQHWVGYRDVIIRRMSNGWAVPSYNNRCLMTNIFVDSFCGVCTADLIRRMAYITKEPFHGRSPRSYPAIHLHPWDVPNSPNYPWTHTAYIPIPSGTTRILDSAFHGNRAVQTVRIPASVVTIGDFAFIGATGLRTIHNNALGVIPQQINNTTFTGVDRSRVTVYVPAGTIPAFIEAGWGGFRLVDGAGRVAYPIKFEFYGIDNIWHAGASVLPGHTLNMTNVLSAMYEFDTNHDPTSRFAHWGWFTEEALNASGRYSTERNVAAGLRRPVVGTTGFDVNQVITQEVLDRYARDGVIHLHSVWSLWGDLNDDDLVNSDDLRILTWHVGQQSPRPTLNLAAADVHRNGIVNSDDLRDLTWYVGQLSPRPVLGASPATNLANTFIDDSSRLTNNEAIWHISHEVITPDAEYVDIRVYLYQNPTNSTNPHGGMDVTFIRFGYDSDVLSNPRQTPAMNFFDFSLLTEVERIDFNAMVTTFTGFPFFMTYEAARDAAKGQSMFAHAWVRPTVANHEGFRFTMHYSYEHFGSGGHGLGPHILQLNWSPEAGHNPNGYPFVYVRFDVTADLPVGTVTPLTFLAEQDMSGDIEVVTNAGSVTIVAE